MQTYTDTPTKRRWTLQNIIFLAIIAIFFGVIYEVWAFAYYAVAATPLKPFANDLTLGVWLMAGPLAGMLIKLPGATILGEVLAAAVEMFLFSSWGAANLISGAVQGFGSELGFAATGYKNWDKLGLALSVVTSTLVTYAWAWFNDGYNAYEPMMALALLGARFLSIAFFAGVLVYGIKRLVEKSGMLQN